MSATSVSYIHPNTPRKPAMSQSSADIPAKQSTPASAASPVAQKSKELSLYHPNNKYDPILSLSLPLQQSPSPHTIATISLFFLAVAWCLLWSIRMHLIFSCIFMGLAGLIYSIKLHIDEHGILSYLPTDLQNKLLNESLVDIIQSPIIDKMVALNILALFTMELAPDER